VKIKQHPFTELALHDPSRPASVADLRLPFEGLGMLFQLWFSHAISFL
jgi:hypothetical protein